MRPVTALARAARDASPEAVARAMQILLAAETPVSVTNPSAAATVALSHLEGRECEALVCIALDRRRRVIESGVLTAGSSGFTIVDPAQIFRWALTRARPVSAIILAHNHPSGDVTPSSQDREVTSRVARAGSVVGVMLLDHLVVVDGGGWRSMANEGLVPNFTAQAGWTG